MLGSHRHLRPRIIADGAGATMRFLGRNHPRVAHSIPAEQTCSVERRLQHVDDDGVILHPLFKCLKTLTADPGMKRDAGLSTVLGRWRPARNGGPWP